MGIDKPQNSRNKGLKLLTVFFFAAFLLFAAAFSLPSLISTHWGKEKILGILNQRIPGTITVDEIALSWFGEQKIQGIRLRDADGREILHAGSFLTSASLLDFLLKNDLSAHRSLLSDLNAMIVDEGNGFTNLQKALGFEFSGKSKPGSQFEVQLKNVSGHFLPEKDTDRLVFQFRGMTLKNGMEGRIDVDAKFDRMDLKNFIHSEEYLSPNNKQIQISAKAEHFPVLVLDQLLSLVYPHYQGILLELLGDQIHLEIHQDQKDNFWTFQLNARSPSFSANLNGNYNYSPEGSDAVVNIDILAKFDDSPFNIHLQSKVNPLKPGLRVEGQFEKIPSSVLGLVLKSDLSPYLGPKVDLNAELHIPTPGEIKGSIAINSERIKIPALKIEMTGKESAVTASNFVYHWQKYPVEAKNVEFIFDPYEKMSQWKSISSIVSKGIIRIGELNLLDPGQAVIATIQNAHIPWDVNAPSNLIQLTLSAKTQLVEQSIEGNLEGTVSLKNWLANQSLHLADADVEAQMHLGKVPLAFLDTWLDSIDAAKFLGPTLDLDLNLKGNITPQNSSYGSLDLHMRSRELSGNISLDLADTITLQKPASVKFNLTPDAFRMLGGLLQQKTSFELLENAGLTVDIHQLSVPRKDLSWKKAVVNLEAAVDTIKLGESTSRAVWVWRDLKASMTSSDLGKKVSFKVYSQPNETGTIDLAGNAENLWTNEGALNIQDMIIGIEGKAQNLPVRSITRFLTNNPSLSFKAEALFGVAMNADIKAQLRQMNGPIRLEINGLNGNLLLDGVVKNGILTLNQNLAGQFNLTPQLSRQVLGNVIPVLGDILGSDRPMSINIDSQGFAVQLSPFSISGVQISKASLDVGKVKFSGEGKLAETVRVLNVATGNTIPIWFTPIYFNMKDGVLDLNRFDFLLMGQFPLALWGKINFPKDKISMIVGVGGRAISQAFGVKNFPADALVQIPLKGTIQNASIDTRQATAKITALAAQQQGPQGMLIGSILNLASGSFKEDSEPPPPTTQPLPWQNMYEETASNDPKQVQDVVMDPIKEVGKGAANLLKNILK